MIKGAGTAAFDPIEFGARPFAPILPSRSRVLLVTDNYPSYHDLYRNGFVHARIREYRRSGLGVDVFVARTQGDLAYREFEGVEVAEGSAEAIGQMLDAERYDHVVVHFMNRTMWDVLEGYVGKIPITIWIHGWEIHAWWRRAVVHRTAEALEAARAKSELRTEMWRAVFAHSDPALRFVFVSEAFRDEVCGDLLGQGIGVNPEQVVVIHNPIDTNVFTYSPKDPEQRKKILLIRPFASALYANDLAVGAIEELADEPWFGELSFRIVGDGPLFEETTAPLARFGNVVLERRFLSHSEIAALHKEYGVFLVPSRMDSQGVSRGEAMSSGLVPITSAVAAIPEFVSDVEGYLAREDDAHGLAEAIRDLYRSPEAFTRKSAAAARRVRRQVGVDTIIPQEIELLTKPTTGGYLPRWQKENRKWRNGRTPEKSRA
jgi:glycosyltransferase involved in cell wall biosynthesis